MKSLELFSGIGGFGAGMSRVGFNPVMVIDNDKNCINVLLKNKMNNVKYLENWPIQEACVESLDFRELETSVDLIFGGPPCQPFSLGGKGFAHFDKRNGFPSVIRSIREVKPKCFIFENVKGLTRSTFSNYLEYIKLSLTFPDIKVEKNESWEKHFKRLQDQFTQGIMTGTRYNVIHKVLNSADYGIPQKRERIFIVGFRNDLGIKWHFPEKTHEHLALLYDKVHGDYWERNGVPKKERNLSMRSIVNSFDKKPVLKPWTTIREALCDLSDPKQSTDLFKNHEFRGGARIYPGHTGSPIDEPAKTLKAGIHGVPGGENMIRFNNGTVRYFTIRESARLQGFSDNFIFYSSWSKTINQIGNAVPVKMAEILGMSLMNALQTKLQ